VWQLHEVSCLEELLVRYDQMYATGSFVALALAHLKTLQAAEVV
jgi:hypothetical protein